MVKGIWIWIWIDRLEGQDVTTRIIHEVGVELKLLIVTAFLSIYACTQLYPSPSPRHSRFQVHPSQSHKHKHKS